MKINNSHHDIINYISILINPPPHNSAFKDFLFDGEILFWNSIVSPGFYNYTNGFTMFNNKETVLPKKIKWNRYMINVGDMSLIHSNLIIRDFSNLCFNKYIKVK